MKWIPFFTYAVLCAYTPGPSNITAMSCSSTWGVRRTLPLISGICLGYLLVISLTCFFSTTLAATLPRFIPVMKYMGALYILYLAYKIFMETWEDNRGEKKAEGLYSLRSGLTLQLMNVKMFLYGLTGMTTFVIPYSNSVKTLFFSTLFLIVIGCSGAFTWVLFGALFRRSFQLHSRKIGLTLSGLLVYSALTMIL